MSSDNCAPSSLKVEPLSLGIRVSIISSPVGIRLLFSKPWLLIHRDVVTALARAEI